MPLLAVDVGNSRLKFGLFPDRTTANGLPACTAFWTLPANYAESEWQVLVEAIGKQSAESSGVSAVIATVNPPARDRLLQAWPRAWSPPLIVDSFRQLPIVNRTDPPERTGLDRLLKGVAGNRLRNPEQPVILVDSGTAATVDWVTEVGEFAGGAILAGLGLSAWALHAQTAQLPLVPTEDFDQDIPAVLGRRTLTAMQSGLYWGHIGAIREVIHQLEISRGGERSPVTPLLLFTGGAGHLVANQLGYPEHYHRYLTLQGLALTAEAMLHGDGC